MLRDNEKPRTEKKNSSLIRLDDLLPRQNVKGGKGDPRTVFGSVDARNRNRRSGGSL